MLGQAHGFEKPCGGLLAPDAQQMLGRFGLTLPAHLLVDPQIFAVRTIDLQSELARYYQRFYLNCDRAAFDRWLISLMPDHIEYRPESRVERIKALPKGGYLLQINQEESSRELRARFVVGADGSFSFVRRQLMPAAQIMRYVAIQEIYEDVHEQPFYSVLFDKRITPCYCWALSKNGRFILGGAFPHDDVRARFERLKEAARKVDFHFGEVLERQSCLVSYPTHRRELCLGDGAGAFLAGEAAGFISPSSLEGLSYAFDSAQLLAQAFNGALSCTVATREGDSPLLADSPEELAACYRRLCRPLRRKLRKKTAKAAALYNPALRRLIMKSGLSALSPL